jgi:hypothetical protein
MLLVTLSVELSVVAPVTPRVEATTTAPWRREVPSIFNVPEPEILPSMERTPEPEILLATFNVELRVTALVTPKVPPTVTFPCRLDVESILSVPELVIFDSTESTPDAERLPVTGRLPLTPLLR